MTDAGSTGPHIRMAAGPGYVPAFHSPSAHQQRTGPDQNRRRAGIYGLAELKHQHSASDQLSFLEGLLPLEEPVFLLPSVGMPSGRVADVHLFADDDMTWVVLLDVTAEHDDTRKIQQKAYDMTLLSQREARLIAKLEAAHKELTLAHRDLAKSRDQILRIHNRLKQELRDAEQYVFAILPAPAAEPIAVDWLFVPSTELGGDSFGYHWIDSEHFALYLLAAQPRRSGWCAGASWGRCG